MSSIGSRARLRRVDLPGLGAYYVLALLTDDPAPEELEALYRLALREGRRLARERYGDPECYTLLYNAARTRRRPWPHVHILLASSVWEKRKALLLFQLKHLLRWRRWPMLRLLRSFLALGAVAEGRSPP